MAGVKIRVDTVSQLAGGSFQVGFTILVGTTEWQPNQMCQGASQADITAAANQIAAAFVDAESERQAMKLKAGTAWDTGLNLKLDTP